jgi:hypothetical protein
MLLLAFFIIFSLNFPGRRRNKGMKSEYRASIFKLLKNRFLAPINCSQIPARYYSTLDETLSFMSSYFVSPPPPPSYHSTFLTSFAVFPISVQQILVYRACFEEIREGTTRDDSKKMWASFSTSYLLLIGM